MADEVFKEDFFERVVNVQWGGLPRDLYFFGLMNNEGGTPHIRIGIRKGEIVVLERGGYFGMTDPPDTGFGLSTPIPSMPIPEVPILFPYYKSNKGYFNSLNPTNRVQINIETGESVIGSNYSSSSFDGIGDPDDPRAKHINAIGDRPLSYFTDKRIDLYKTLYQEASNGDYFVDDKTSHLNLASTRWFLKNKKGETTGTVNVAAVYEQITHGGFGPVGYLTGSGQWHIPGIIEGGGRHYFVITDFDPPSGSGAIAYNPGSEDNPFLQVTQEYKNEQTFWIRFFDWTGREVAKRLRWGHSIRRSDAVGVAPNGVYYSYVVIPTQEAYPRDTVQLYATADDSKKTGEPI